MKGLFSRLAGARADAAPDKAPPTLITGDLIRVALGVATEKQAGWIGLVQAELDVTAEADWSRRFAPASIDDILAEHVWEHLTWTQARNAATLAFRYLKPGGRLRLAVPDTFHASRFIVDAVSATGSLAHEHGHLVDYNYRLMTRLLSEAGFEVELLDWWDEAGEFHNGYGNDDAHGYIMRSYVNWPNHANVYVEPATYNRIVESTPEPQRQRLVERQINHTSLIVDGIKPAAVA